MPRLPPADGSAAGFTRGAVAALGWLTTGGPEPLPGDMAAPVTSAVVAAGRRTPSAPGLPSAAPPDPTCARHGVGRGQLDPSARITAILEPPRLGRAHDVRWPTARRLAATRDGQG